MSKRGIEAGRAYVRAWFDDSLVTRGLKRMKASFAAAGAGLMKVGGGLVGAGAGLAGLFAAPIKAAADLETTRASYTTLLGSAEKAKQVLGDLQKFAAATPFELPELNEAGKKLLAFNVSAEDMIPTLRKVGDISAGIGAPIGEIAELYGKAKVQGRLFGEDINQLTGRGIPIIQELAKQFGVSESKVKDLVESGKVNFGHLDKAFTDLTASGGKFGGLMDAQSKTLNGRWSSMKDNAVQAMIPIGEAILPVVGSIVDKVSAGAQRVGEFAKANAHLVKYVVMGAAGVLGLGAAFLVAGGLISVAGTAVGAVVSVLTVLGGIVGFLLSPIGLVVAAITAAAGAGAYMAYQSGLLGEALTWLQERFGPLVDAAKKAFAVLKNALAAGEFGAAAKVLWAAIKLAFAKGIEWVRGAWVDLKAFLATTFVNVAGQIRGVWIDLVEWMAQALGDGIAAPLRKIADIRRKVAENLGLGGLIDADPMQKLLEGTAVLVEASAKDPQVFDKLRDQEADERRKVEDEIAAQAEKDKAELAKGTEAAAAEFKSAVDEATKATAAAEAAAKAAEEAKPAESKSSTTPAQPPGKTAVKGRDAINQAAVVGSTEGAEAFFKAITGGGDSDKVVGSIETQTKVMERHHRENKRSQVVVGKVVT